MTKTNQYLIWLDLSTYVSLQTPKSQQIKSPIANVSQKLSISESIHFPANLSLVILSKVKWMSREVFHADFPTSLSNWNVQLSRGCTGAALGFPASAACKDEGGGGGGMRRRRGRDEGM